MSRTALFRRPSGPLWRHRDFLKLWAAQATSAFGSRISRTVLPVIALVTIDANPAEIGLLSALSVAPGVVVGLLFGGVVDRSEKRPLLVGADILRAALLFTVPLAAWLARNSHTGHGLRDAVPSTGQESRAARCSASGERLDAPCRRDSVAQAVASMRIAG